MRPRGVNTTGDFHSAVLLRSSLSKDDSSLLWGAVAHVGFLYAAMALGFLALSLLTRDTRRLQEIKAALRAASVRPATADDYAQLPGMGLI